ncbi:MAG: hypothetical protein HN778_18275 [Prolixibacteraceae bacterium]|jgi:peptidyl-prolyl cis-trans isomerase SurA|nr:hypothetical protein [Prolixibacteraceae bacterium]MBT6764637.1 hypothetical protein [Prolixibacteraceae bacterium]MBT6999536.1 hypothetical protein [Prolixibacteraceae bacterium]MBT7396780.1 hypothetical protein [Prolixibacteraceae bacterium]
MNRIILLIVVLLNSILNVSAQENETLLSIRKTKVDRAEFERIYKKNNQNLFNESDRKSPKEYLELFINFKLKVIEAESLKMDRDTVFINELAGYRKELAVPYLTNIKFNEEMVHEVYDRMLKEVNASHILFKLDKSAGIEEEQAVLEKTIKIREELLAGKDFNEAAKEYSDDPSAKSNGGSLGYFTAFQMVFPFEEAAFNTAVNEISEPIRSSFGYHLIKVHDIRKNRGEIKVAHIMKMFPQGITAPGKAKLKTEIDSIYSALENGADFTEMVKQFSDDKRSSEQDGEMPWFSSSRMVPEFAGPAFNIKNKGDFTKPVETQFGYHIIKKLDERQVASFEDSKAEIENKIKKDPARSTYSKQAFIDNLKSEYNFVENVKNIEILKNKNIGDDLENKHLKLFIIDNKNFNIADFNSFLQNEKIQTGTYAGNFNKWVDYEITKLEDSKLEDKYPDFRYLMQEYHDGILLFNISEDKIWNFASQDSAGLKKFYDKNKGEYLWEERFKGSIVICKDTLLRETAEKYYAAGMSSDEVIDQLNKEGEMVVINENAWEKGSHPIVDYFVWNGPEPEHFNGKVTFIRGDKIPPEAKNLNEARGLYISDYQNYLEKIWLKKLRRKYRVKVNKKLLNLIPDA